VLGRKQRLPPSPGVVGQKLSRGPRPPAIITQWENKKYYYKKPLALFRESDDDEL